MKRFGYVKAAACVPHLEIADPKKNAEYICEMIQKSDGDLLVFPQLCLSGYTCGDLFLHKSLIEACETALADVCEASKKAEGKLIFVGLPVKCAGRLYNCAAAIANGTILGVVPKTHVPHQGDVNEFRWFAKADDAAFDTVTLLGQKVPFGNDLLFYDETSDLIVGAELGEDLFAADAVSTRLAASGANVIVNLAASGEVLTAKDRRDLMTSSQSAKTIAGYVYASAGLDESTSDAVYSGHSMIYVCGKKKAEQEFTFGEISALIDLECIAHDRMLRDNASYAPCRMIGYTGCDTAHLPQMLCRYPFIPQDGDALRERCEQIIRLQASGLAVRLRKIRAKTAVVGISGGLDSTLALIVTAEAFRMCDLPSENVLAITMPGFGTTNQTFDNAKELIEKFGATMRIVPIADACLQHFKDIGHDVNDHDVTYENTQARERTQILMDIANKAGGIVVGTGDLSELALGWCTYNGDHMSMYSVNAALPKTLMQYVIAEYAKAHPECAAVLQGVLDTPISPELLPPDAQGNIAQKTEERIGKYDIHDFILYHALRFGFAPDKIYALAKIAFYDVEQEQLLSTMRTFYWRFFTQQFKRNCVPDGVKLGTVGFSPRGGWCMPSDASARMWLDQVEKLQAE